jgi:hypothetical protein
MASVIVTLGFGPTTKRGELELGRRNEFAFAVRSSLNDVGVVLYEIYGEQYTPGFGQEKGAWFAATGISVMDLEKLKAELRDLANEYGQDAIQMVEGVSALIGPGNYNPFECDGGQCNA